MSPRSAGCSMMKSPPDACVACSSRHVRATSALARSSSGRWALGTSVSPEGSSRVRRTCGPPSSEEVDRK
eukprot:6197961-Pleurochrysis_carterae.AAC.2